MSAFEYEVVDGKYILTKLKDTSLTKVVIPHVFSEIGGYYKNTIWEGDDIVETPDGQARWDSERRLRGGFPKL